MGRPAPDTTRARPNVATGRVDFAPVYFTPSLFHVGAIPARRKPPDRHFHPQKPQGIDPPMTTAAHFSPSYAEARRRFLAAAAARGLAIESHAHPGGRGAEGEDLATDVALLGAADWPALFVVSSGTHGVEGFCGSGCQLALLHDDVLLAGMARARVGLLLVHAVNPYGFSHLHRTNEDNIDLNRNFRDFAEPYPLNPGYEQVHALWVPDAWPPAEADEARLAALVAGLDDDTRRRLSGGQATHPDGLFYAGERPAWSNGVVRRALGRHGAGRRSIAWVDVHTGLGPRGHGEKIFGSHPPERTARARRWWGRDLILASDPSSVSPRTTGHITAIAPVECPDAATTTMTLEYGTLPHPQVRGALRADAWLRAHPDAGAARTAAIKRQIRDAFFVDADDWKGLVLGQFRAAALQSVNGLAEDPV